LPGFQDNYAFRDTLHKLNFIVFVLVVKLNFSKYGPQFRMRFTVMSILTVGESTIIFVIKWFINRDRKRDLAAETAISVRENWG
jgi:ACS family pantothenate transporter-like MFS transporter